MRRAITAAVAAVLMTAACAHSDLRMTVLFDDPEGLSVGDEVRIHDKRVGEVTALRKADDGVAVDLLIAQPHRARVTDDAGFEIERKALLDGDKVISIEPGKGEPLSQGARVRGTPPLMQRLSGWAKDAIAWIKSPELRERLSDFRDAVKKAAEKGRDGFADARPVLEDKAEELVELARGEGDDVAERLRETLKKLLDKVADDLDG